MLAQLAAIAVIGGGSVNPVPLREGAGLGNTEQVGLMLYTDYLIPFEVASMLLLVAMIGAIVLTKKEI